jgi:hypothetical protein
LRDPSLDVGDLGGAGLIASPEIPTIARILGGEIRLTGPQLVALGDQLIAKRLERLERRPIESPFSGSPGVV